ncbi:MAG TPA: CopD family protein [Solirubrobacteraceae bacterium]|nr:CopD family protein [Solirubrobacteraceae bacterium]
MRRAVAALVVGAALLAPASASAHATLQASSPERGQRLSAPPEEVMLRFDEPVEASFGALRVFDERGREVQQGEPFRPGGRSTQVAVRLRPGLGRGGFTATYRVISADSHPVSGGFVFTVGDASAPAKTVDELLQGGDAGPVTATALAVVRAVQYAAIAIALGALVFLLWAWAPLRIGDAAGAAFARGLRRLLVVASAAGLLSALAGLVLQGATAGGTSVWVALDAAVIDAVLSTRFGGVWGAGALAWLAALIGALAVPPGAALLPPLLALALLPALGGHAGVQPPVWLNASANVVHVLAVSAWLGGIAVLVLVLRGATRELEPAERTRALAATVGRFSTLAGGAIALVLATGVVQAVIGMSAFGELLDTPYGRAVLIKLALLLAIIGFGWLNRARLLPRLRSATTPGAAGVLLRRTLRVELALAAVVLGTTGALAGYQPSNTVAAGPFATDVRLGPGRLEVTVQPARVGANEMHLYLFARSDGRQYDATKELTVHASLPGKRVAPIELSPRKAGPGHYVVSGAAFAIAGDWKVEVAARVSEFDEHRTSFEVPIR